MQILEEQPCGHDWAIKKCKLDIVNFLSILTRKFTTNTCRLYVWGELTLWQKSNMLPPSVVQGGVAGGIFMLWFNNLRRLKLCWMDNLWWTQKYDPWLQPTILDHGAYRPLYRYIDPLLNTFAINILWEF